MQCGFIWKQFCVFHFYSKYTQMFSNWRPPGASANCIHTKWANLLVPIFSWYESMWHESLKIFESPTSRTHTLEAIGCLCSHSITSQSLLVSHWELVERPDAKPLCRTKIQIENIFLLINENPFLTLNRCTFALSTSQIIMLYQLYS